ncbi:MAG: hypothetical protein V4568_20330 [Pseudomonadota bacterium]
MRHNEVSLTLLLVRYWWPFWLFKDATNGDVFARSAAYQHNRENRIYLPGYLAKWVLICLLALVLTSYFETLAVEVSVFSDIFTGVAAGWAIVFAFGICVLLKTGYVYLYLSGHEF